LSDTTWLILGLASVALLIAVNAFFVAAELAFVSVRRTRIEQLAGEGHVRARLLLAALKDLDRVIATTQLGITMAGLALGFLGEPALARIIEPPVEALLYWAPDGAGRAAAFVLSFTMITTLLIVLGELAPKGFALQRSEGTALALSLPLAAFNRIFQPLTWLLNWLGRAVLRAFGVGSASGRGDNLSPEELELVIEASARAGLLSTSELVLARRALEFGAIQADQIMVPRTEVVAIDIATPLEDVLATVEAAQHTRYPVFDGDLDHVTGMLDAKDLIGLVHRGGTDWRPLIRPAAAVPEGVSVEIAVAEMRARAVQLLVLVDEHGGTSGIVTADEVLYRLLGRWLGGARAAGQPVRPLSNGNFLLSGLALIADVEDATGADLSGEDYDTVGGFVMTRLARIPKVGDRVAFQGYEFRVMAMDGRRVDRVFLMKE
jgi:CBS domain containing-hemolysin-like protein